jgi:hypothetical protein
LRLEQQPMALARVWDSALALQQLSPALTPLQSA